jgi:hypothetical protein
VRRKGNAKQGQESKCKAVEQPWNELSSDAAETHCATKRSTAKKRAACGLAPDRRQGESYPSPLYNEMEENTMEENGKTRIIASVTEDKRVYVNVMALNPKDAVLILTAITVQLADAMGVPIKDLGRKVWRKVCRCAMAWRIMDAASTLAPDGKPERPHVINIESK